MGNEKLIFRIIAISLLCLSLSAFQGGEKLAVAERFEVNLQVLSDSSMIVEERIVFRFSGGPFTFAYRDLETSYTDGIDTIQAEMDGAQFPNGNKPGQVEITGDGPIKVTWHYAPVSDSTHAFLLRYHVAGAIRQVEGADQLKWWAIPSAHDYLIDSAVVCVKRPTGVQVTRSVTLDVPFQLEQNGSAAGCLVTGAIQPGKGVVATVNYAQGSLLSSPPQWQVMEREKQKMGSLAILSGVLGLLLPLGLGFIALSRLKHSLDEDPDKFSQPEAHDQSINPPNQLPPGLVAMLVHNQIEPLATFYDLARRGLLRPLVSVDEVDPKKKTRTNRLHQHGFTVSRDSKDIRSHEKAVLEMVRMGYGRLRGKADRGGIRDIITAMRDINISDMADMGLIDTERLGGMKIQLQKMESITGYSGIACFIGVVLFVIGASISGVDNLAGFILCIGGGLAVALGILQMGHYTVYKNSLPLSAQGRQEKANWIRYAKHLRERLWTDPGEFNSSLIEQTLVYAAAFGFNRRLVKAFEQAKQQLPIWFAPLRSCNTYIVQYRIQAFTGELGMTFSILSAGDGGGGGGGDGGGGGGDAGGGGGTGVG